MANADLSRRVGKVVGYPPLVEMSAEQRRELHEALLESDTIEDRMSRATRSTGSIGCCYTSTRKRFGVTGRWHGARVGCDGDDETAPGGD